MKMNNTIYSRTSWFWELSKGNKELFIQDNCPFERYSFEIIKPTTPIPTKPVTVRIEAVIMSTPNMGLFDWPDNVALILAGVIMIPMPVNSIIINMIEIIVSLSIIFFRHNLSYSLSKTYVLSTAAAIFVFLL